MAVLRNPPRCVKCLKEINALYAYRGENFVGDTFVMWDWAGHRCNPPEGSKPCPNCGELNWVSNLVYTSTKRIDSPPHGSFVSTIYGVCEKCANNHSK